MTTPEAGESTSNPNLIDDWESQTQVVLNSGRVEELPWSNNGVSTQLSSDFCKKIKKSEGWTMLMHTFQAVGESRQQNYMMFYNLFTGVVKVFYFYEGYQTATKTQWVVYAKPLSGSAPYKFMDLPYYFSNADEIPGANHDHRLFMTNESALSSMNNGIPNGLQPGWNGFEFQVTRYADDLTDCDFKIGAYNISVTSSSFNGNMNLSTSGTVTSETNAGSSSDKKTVNSIATYAGEKAQNAIKGMKDQSSNPGIGVKIANSVLELAADVANWGVAGVLKAGLRLIFGRSTTVSTYTTTSDVRLSSEGEMTMSGISELVAVSDVPVISFNFKDVLAAQTRSTLIKPTFPPIVVPKAYGVESGYQPVVKAELENIGVWTIRKTPVIYWDVVKPMSVGSIEDEGGNMLISGSSYCPTVSKYELDVVVNPYIDPWVGEKRVSMELIGYVPSEDSPNEDTEDSPNEDTEDSPNEYTYDFPNEFNCMDLSRDNFIFSDSYKALYKLSTKASFVAFYGVGSDYRPFDESSMPQIYVKWRMPKRYQIVALVTVELDISYQGNTFTVTESRVYPTKTVINSSDIKTDFPRTLLLDDNNAWLSQRVFR